MTLVKSLLYYTYHIMAFIGFCLYMIIMNSYIKNQNEMSYETMLLLVMFIMLILLTPFALSNSGKFTGTITINGMTPTNLAQTIDHLKKENII